MPRTSWEKLGEFRVAPPAVPEQRAIADYLDTETARIDATIAKKRHLINLLDERYRSVIASEVWGPVATGNAVVPLRRLTQRINVGIAEAATQAYESHGFPSCER
ncbi:MAG TPA: hypothetical protein VL068_12845 [Microthrixaceae bacterium]|nr:hypothetical protein [Microthrixaceae bacterium]